MNHRPIISLLASAVMNHFLSADVLVLLRSHSLAQVCFLSETWATLCLFGQCIIYTLFKCIMYCYFLISGYWTPMHKILLKKKLIDGNFGFCFSANLIVFFKIKMGSHFSIWNTHRIFKMNYDLFFKSERGRSEQDCETNLNLLGQNFLQIHKG